MSENNRSYTLKLTGMAFCAVTAVILAALICVKAYTGGQIKTVSDVCTAITRDIYADYRACFADGSEYLSEKGFEEFRSNYEAEWGEDFHIKAEFLSREAAGNGYNVNVRLTVYNDIAHEASPASFHMTRRDGKWVIDE